MSELNEIKEENIDEEMKSETDGADTQMVLPAIEMLGQCFDQLPTSSTAGFETRRRKTRPMHTAPLKRERPGRPFVAAQTSPIS